MGIYSRLSDIINSNMHAMVRSTSVRTIARKKTLERKHKALNRDTAEWERKAELAIRHEREDLARAALLAKQRIVDVQQEITDELKVLDEEQDKLDTDIAKLKSKLADAKARQKSIVMRKRSATTRVRVQQQVNSEKIDNAMAQFESYERRIDSLEAEAESYDLGRQDLNDEFAELESSEQVEGQALGLELNPSRKG